MRFKIPDGAVVKFRHERKRASGNVVSIDEGPLPVLPRGGQTVCRVILPDGSEIEGVAHCSKKDNYSKKLGRDIALGRALAAISKREAS